MAFDGVSEVSEGERRWVWVRERSREWPSWDLTPRQTDEVELLLTGVLAPLTGFMTRKDAEEVERSMHLADGSTFWPVPVVLSVSEEAARKVRPDAPLVLRDQEGAILALLWVEDLWAGATTGEGAVCAGGVLERVKLPAHPGFDGLWPTPEEARARYAGEGWERVMSLQTEAVLHRSDVEVASRLAIHSDANVLVHARGPGDGPGVGAEYARVRATIAAVSRFPAGRAALALMPGLPAASSDRRALLRACVARNYGCTHLLLHGLEGGAEPGRGSQPAEGGGAPPGDVLAGLGLEVLEWPRHVFAPALNAWVAEREVPAGMPTVTLSDSEVGARLDAGQGLPEWFTYPEVSDELRRARPPRWSQGFTVFFTGLSAAGKSSVAKALMASLLERGERPVTLLDGDIVRRNLSSELGFSKEHRDLNIRRIGFVASEITKNGGVALCAPIAPYDAVRRSVRAMIEPLGGFILVHVATPLSVCEQRDPKGLYAKARAGLVKQFTGISDPYEAPTDAEIVLDASDMTPAACAAVVVDHLKGAGYLKDGLG